MILRFGMAIEDAGEDEARHRHAGFVRPPERPPDLELRFRLARVVADVGAAIRVQPHRQVERRHALDERQVFRRVERLAVDVREELNAPGAQLGDRALDLAHRRIGIAKRQRGDESRKTIRMLPHELRHPVVGEARQIDAVLPLRVDLDRRRRDRQDLLIVLEAIHDAEALVEIDQHRDAAHALADVLESRRDRQHAIEIRPRVDVIEDVELAHGRKSSAYCARSCRARAADHAPTERSPYAGRAPIDRRYGAITCRPNRSISSSCGLHCSSSRSTPAASNSRTRSSTCFGRADQARSQAAVRHRVVLERDALLELRVRRSTAGSCRSRPPTA